MKKIKNLLFLFAVITVTAKAQNAPLLQAQKSFGGSDYDAAYSTQQTKDGGFIVAGISLSADGDVTGNHGSYDCWVIKLNSSGIIQWKKALGGSLADAGVSVRQTNDGGYIVASYAESKDGDVDGNHGNQDYWIVKLDESGNTVWKKCFGGTLYDYPADIKQTKDGGYIIAGYTYSNNGDVTGNHGNYDCWIVKIDAKANIQWQKCFGGSAYDAGFSIVQTGDGNYIVAGCTLSKNGDVVGNHGGYDYWVLKLDVAGNKLWQKPLGGSGDDFAYSIDQTSDGGYIVAGSSNSKNGDVSGNHGSDDYWIVKLDTGANIQWQKSLGGAASEIAKSIHATKDGGCGITGYSKSGDGDVTGAHGSNDCWVVKLDVKGNIQWQRDLGGSNDDGGKNIQQTKDGGYIVAGYAQSNDGDVSGNHGSSDYWLVKLSSSGNIVEKQPVSASASTLINQPITHLTISPNPVHSILHIQGLSASMNYEIRIINERGDVVLQSSVKNISFYDLDLSKLTAGIYYLQAGEEKIKFLKE